MKNILITESGKKKLIKKLEKLKKYNIPKIINSILEARKFGDLKENSEYHSAKEELIICKKKINNIEKKLIKIKTINIKKIKIKNKIIFGCKVKIKNLNDNKIYTYRIVGDDESNIKKNMISVNSPIGKKLIGKKNKETIAVQTPIGKVKIKILEIKK